MDGETRIYQRPWFWIFAWVVVLLGLYIWNGFIRKAVTTQNQHAAAISAVAFSPDATRAVSGSEDGAVRVWDATTGVEIARQAHGAAVSAIAFSPDGQLVVSGATDGSLRVWRAGTGQEVARMNHGGAVSAVTFSADGQTVAAGTTSGALRVWNTWTGQETGRRTRDGVIFDLAYDANSRRALSGDAAGVVRLWNADDGQDQRSVTHAGGVVDAAISGDRLRIVSAGADSSVIVWDVAKGEAIATWKATKDLKAVAISADGRWVLTGSSDGTVRVWQVSNKTAGAKNTHEGSAQAVAFSPNKPRSSTSYLAVTGGKDKIARIWDARTGNVLVRTALTILGNLGAALLLYILWLAFFAQFTLPLRTFKQRCQIFWRLFVSIFGTPGAALFVKDGKVQAAEGETEKRGAGVIWMDSASAGMLRTDTSMQETIGPGVHFTKKGHYLASVIDLRTQRDALGHGDNPKLFEPIDPKTEDATLKAANEVRLAVRGMTRDGIEVVPNISVMFSIDANPPDLADEFDHIPGSRFGYKEESVEKAVLGEAVNPKRKPEEVAYYRVPWNRLPILLAVDLWREYLSKFKLDELFKPTREFRPEPPAPPAPSPSETSSLSRQIRAEKTPHGLRAALTEMLHVLNNGLGRLAERIDPQEPLPKATGPIDSGATASDEVKLETAWQTIVRMVNDRMKKEQVDILDRTGTRVAGKQHSDEYHFLKNRGIRVISVSISNPRFPPEVEKELIRMWESDWLRNAYLERDRLAREMSRLEIDRRGKVLRAHAKVLSSKIDALLDQAQRDQMPMGEVIFDQSGEEPPKPSLKATLRKLLQTTRSELVGVDKAHHLLSAEIEAVTEIIQWLEGRLK